MLAIASLPKIKQATGNSNNTHTKMPPGMPFEDDCPRELNLMSPFANRAAIHVVQVPYEITA